MKENTWYSCGQDYIIKFDDLYVVYWNQGISIVHSITDWTHFDDVSEIKNIFPNWKQNIIKSIFKQEVETEGEYRGIRIINPSHTSCRIWNWGN